MLRISPEEPEEMNKQRKEKKQILKEPALGSEEEQNSERTKEAG